MTLNALVTLLKTDSQTDVVQVIETLKARRAVPKLDDYRKQFQVTGHDSMDVAKRPDKQIKDASGNAVRMEKVNRVGIGMQEIIAERAVSFLFGNPVEIQCEPENDNQKRFLAALKRILKDNKIDSFNAEIALEMFRSTEVAECWFPVEKQEAHTDYGFSTRFKLRVMAFSPWDGNELYPLFDETGDMIAFSRAFKMLEADADSRQAECRPAECRPKEISYFETYTAAEKIAWKQTGSTWEEVSRAENVIGKIPIVYGRQQSVEWAGIQNLIDRLEKLLSNYADTNDYHGSPTIFVKGKIAGWGQKGESGKIIEGDKEATAEYLSWSQAPEMVKLEIEVMFRLIYSLSQTPDISFDSVKNLGDISGVALKLLFLDAHLKVKKKQRVFDAYLERRTSIIKSYIAFMDTSLKADASRINVEAKIQPFMIDDLKSLIDLLSTASGGKPIISQKTAVAQAGIVENVDEEYDTIQEEAERDKSFDVLEPSTI